MGIDDHTVKGFVPPSVQFIVEVDGVEKARSIVLKQGDEPELLTVDITNAKTLKLYTSPGGDGVATDSCAWGYAALGKTSNVEEIFATPTPGPTEEPTPTLDKTPGATNTTTPNQEPKDKNGSFLIPVIIISVAVVSAVVVIILIVFKKKK